MIDGQIARQAQAPASLWKGAGAERIRDLRAGCELPLVILGRAQDDVHAAVGVDDAAQFANLQGVGGICGWRQRNKYMHNQSTMISVHEQTNEAGVQKSNASDLRPQKAPPSRAALWYVQH
jgi:hypothetical protein